MCFAVIEKGKKIFKKKYVSKENIVRKGVEGKNINVWNNDHVS